MKKYVSIILSILIVPAYAMEIQKYSQDKENEQDFIRRTKALKKEAIPEKYFDHFHYAPAFQIYLHSAYSPDNKFIAILNKVDCFNNLKDRFRNNKSKPTLVIVDTTNNQKIFETELEEKGHKGFTKIALSCDGNTVATLHQEVDDSIKDQEPLRKDIVTITNLITKQTESHEIPYYFILSQKHPTIAFNQQGTDIIVHGKKNNLMMTNDESWICSPLTSSDPNYATYPYQHHEIIHIAMNTSDPEHS